METVSFSVASFKDDNMVDCSTVTVTNDVPKPNDPKWITPSQQAIVVLGDFLAGVRGGKAADDSFDRRTLLRRARMIQSFLESATKIKKSYHGLTADEVEKIAHETADKTTDKFADTLAKIATWPGQFAKEEKKGQLAKVDSCEFPGRTVLGTCWFEDKFDGASWEIEQVHYSVATTVDSDSAFKSCLRMHMKWEAPDRDSPEVVRERLRQHSRRALTNLDDARRKLNQIQGIGDDN